MSSCTPLLRQIIDTALDADDPERIYQAVAELAASASIDASTATALAATTATLEALLDQADSYIATVPRADRTPALRRLAGAVHDARHGLALRHAHQHTTRSTP